MNNQGDAGQKASFATREDHFQLQSMALLNTKGGYCKSSIQQTSVQHKSPRMSSFNSREIENGSQKTPQLNLNDQQGIGKGNTLSATVTGRMVAQQIVKAEATTEERVSYDDTTSMADLDLLSYHASTINSRELKRAMTKKIRKSESGFEKGKIAPTGSSSNSPSPQQEEFEPATRPFHPTKLVPSATASKKRSASVQVSKHEHRKRRKQQTTADTVSLESDILEKKCMRLLDRHPLVPLRDLMNRLRGVIQAPRFLDSREMQTAHKIALPMWQHQQPGSPGVSPDDIRFHRPTNAIDRLCLLWALFDTLTQVLEYVDEEETLVVDLEKSYKENWEMIQADCIELIAPGLIRKGWKPFPYRHPKWTGKMANFDRASLSAPRQLEESCPIRGPFKRHVRQERTYLYEPSEICEEYLDKERINLLTFGNRLKMPLKVKVRLEEDECPGLVIVDFETKSRPMQR